MPKEVTREARKNSHSPYPVPSSAAEPPQPRQLEECIKIRTGQLLRHRELCGNTIISRGRSKRSSFRAEYRKCHAMKPTIWNYDGANIKASVSLEHAVARSRHHHYTRSQAALLAGSRKVSLSASPQSCELPTFKPSSSIPENDLPLPNPKPPSGGGAAAAAADEGENTVGMQQQVVITSTGSSVGIIIQISLSSDNNVIFQVDFSVRSVEPKSHCRQRSLGPLMQPFLAVASPVLLLKEGAMG